MTKMSVEDAKKKKTPSAPWHGQWDSCDLAPCFYVSRAVNYGAPCPIVFRPFLAPNAHRKPRHCSPPVSCFASSRRPSHPTLARSRSGAGRLFAAEPTKSIGLRTRMMNYFTEVCGPLLWRAPILFYFEAPGAKQTSSEAPAARGDSLSGCGGRAVQSKSAGLEANQGRSGITAQKIKLINPPPPRVFFPPRSPFFPAPLLLLPLPAASGAFWWRAGLKGLRVNESEVDVC
jgi:hypothetical protein